MDGNNVLCALYKVSYTTDTLRRSFLALLSRYVCIKGHSITVIFDGGFTTYPLKSQSGDLTIVDAGLSQSADDVIAALCLERPTREHIVITSDRSLTKKIQQTKTIVITAQEFIKRLELALRPTQKVPTVSSRFEQWISEDTEVDTLMKEAAQKIKKPKLGDEIQPRKSTERTYSRDVGIRDKILDKL